MSGIGLFPKNSVIVAKSAQNVKIKKQVILSADKWMQGTNLYYYTIKDSDVTLDTIVFMRSYKEYMEVIDSAGVMISYPEIFNGEIRVYSTNIPSESITCDYVLCDESKMVGTENASQLSYYDTHQLGVTDVQAALDLLLSKIANQ